MNTSSRQINPPLLEVRDLCLSFTRQKQRVIDHASFSIKSGSTLGLVGASGAGKSSIARVIMQLVKRQSGDILFKGESIFNMDAKRLKATRQNMQIVFQEPSASLSPRRNVEQTLLEPLDHFGIGDGHFRREKIRKTLHTVGLDQDVLKRYPHQFSSGQQQRIAIARALVTDPDLLIADEAVSSLDVSIQAQILQLLQTLQKDLGLTFLFISHDLAVIHQIADEVAVMYHGQLVEQSPIGVFFDNPAHPYSRALLSFAKYQAPGHLVADKWHLNRGQENATKPSGCVYLGDCPDKMPVCEQREPETQPFKNKNQQTLTSHCVRCHLYDEI
jgi:ABC-type oligopeptide transport system ATPase subunit